jgi:hypothetical protein
MPTITPTYAEFVASFPVFADLDSAIVNRHLSIAIRLLEKSVWGDFYSDAIELEAAHNLVLWQQAEAGIQGAAQAAIGPINNVSVAGISTSFSTPSLDGKSKADNWYMKTSYGQQFLRLRDSVIAPGMMV